MILEIMDCVKTIDIPDNFIVNHDNSISVNTNLLNKWIQKVNEELNTNMKETYKANIPLGYFTGIIFFQNSGPTLSASYLINQKIEARYDIKTTTLGINNALIELVLIIECKGNVFLGFESSSLTVNQKIPLALEYVQGDVPQIFPY